MVLVELDLYLVTGPVIYGRRAKGALCALEDACSGLVIGTGSGKAWEREGKILRLGSFMVDVLTMRLAYWIPSSKTCARYRRHVQLEACELEACMFRATMSEQYWTFWKTIPKVIPGVNHDDKKKKMHGSNISGIMRT